MSKRRANSLRRKARRQVALKHRLDGLSYRQIAPLLHASHTTVGRDVLSALGDLVDPKSPESEQLRALLNERYSRLLRVVWPAATKTITDQRGRTVSIYDDKAMKRVLHM